MRITLVELAMFPRTGIPATLLLKLVIFVLRPQINFDTLILIFHTLVHISLRHDQLFVSWKKY